MKPTKLLAGVVLVLTVTTAMTQKVIYQRQGLMLLAAIEGLQKGKPVREEFLYKRVRCNEPAN